MAGKCLWIALFVMLQISFVLCRSTGKPDEENKEFVVSPTSEGPKAEALKETVAPGTMLYDIRINDDQVYVSYDEGLTTAVIIYAIIVPIFIILSLILGCIMICCCKKEPRRGYVVSSAGGQAPGSVQKMADYPPPYGQNY